MRLQWKGGVQKIRKISNLRGSVAILVSDILDVVLPKYFGMT